MADDLGRSVATEYRAPEPDVSEVAKLIGSYLETSPPPHCEGRFSAFGWAEIAQAVLDVEESARRIVAERGS